MTEVIFSENLDADMKSALESIRNFCNVHKCNRYSSKYCAWCLDRHGSVESDFSHQINRDVVERILIETELPEEQELRSDAGEEA